MAWSLADNDPELKKAVTRRMGVHFKRFRHDLNKDYVMKNKTPFTKFSNITQVDWEDFVTYHQSKEFEVFLFIKANYLIFSDLLRILAFFLRQIIFLFKL